MPRVEELQEQFVAELELRAQGHRNEAMRSALNRKLSSSRVEVVSMSRDDKRAQVLVTDLATGQTKTTHVKRTMFGTFMDARGREYYLD